MKPKVWYQSKTIWFNIATSFVLIGEAVAQLDPKYKAPILTVTGLVAALANLWLRAVTTQPITLTKRP